MRQSALVALLWLVPAVAQELVNPQATNQVFGAIWVKGVKITSDALIGSCFQGYGLPGCSNGNGTSQHYGISNQLVPGRSYCLQCCSNPTPTGNDETWDLACPLTLLQQSVIINDISKEYVFARRRNLTDTGLVVCQWPKRTKGLYLVGYTLELVVTEYSASSGAVFWVGVDACSVTAIESTALPTTFTESIRMVSVRPAYTPSPYWYFALGGFLIATLFVAYVGYRGYMRNEHCVNCASKLVFFHSLCLLCILCGCRLRAPPPKVFCIEAYEAELAARASDASSVSSDA
ncbi:hypothetical protein SDRG_03552 [Saprolegnia diclina VS20]|uniref:Uncharacterized protein n=1 Tax=Saprolegnia diclina (strain VS20) TaxID=1156394 RepID=T0S2T9_SAPDV|nr:hypothetical protein SDRG_03552 [Saprolegnia diclina VS20]EQC39348.1 hypothetical protein SDRG_03552 [Saprolegnia diclina VS20]|eukprot:XP_008607409.1 hypothetical protein SDRG_03552 [Saprolegnia diclina VS20]